MICECLPIIKKLPKHSYCIELPINVLNRIVRDCQQITFEFLNPTGSIWGLKPSLLTELSKLFSKWSDHRTPKGVVSHHSWWTKKRFGF